MTDQPEPTPRPKLRRPFNEALASPEDDVHFADTEPNLDALASDEQRKRDPLGAACTLVWLAHITLLQIGEGASDPVEEWTGARAVVELALRCLVLAQAQRIVEDGVPCRTGSSPLLDVSSQLAALAPGANSARAREGEIVRQLGRRLELAVQCLRDWHEKSGNEVSREDVFALARELHFVYRDLRPLTDEKN